jgi:hypothetical protein
MRIDQCADGEESEWPAIRYRGEDSLTVAVAWRPGSMEPETAAQTHAGRGRAVRRGSRFHPVSVVEIL